MSPDRSSVLEQTGAFVRERCEGESSGHDWQHIHRVRQTAHAWLRSLAVDEATAAHVREIVAAVSFKGAGVPTPMRTREGEAVQDADRLDGIGAIGIARAFAYGGFRGLPMHDPEAAPFLAGSAAAYKGRRGSTINHFPEKLLLLAGRMNTETGRRLARERHAFMEAFLERFHAEWDGEA